MNILQSISFNVKNAYQAFKQSQEQVNLERQLFLDMKTTHDVEPFIQALKDGKIKIENRGIRFARSKLISIEWDIFGPEVRINGGPMLDCYPGHYKVSSENGKKLYNTILETYAEQNTYN